VVDDLAVIELETEVHWRHAFVVLLQETGDAQVGQQPLESGCFVRAGSVVQQIVPSFV
jgi:hypothetical protein